MIDVIIINDLGTFTAHYNQTVLCRCRIGIILIEIRFGGRIDILHTDVL